MDQIAAINNENLIDAGHPRKAASCYLSACAEITGKEFEEFTRKDVMAGIESLANKDNIQFCQTA